MLAIFWHFLNHGILICFTVELHHTQRLASNVGTLEKMGYEDYPRKPFRKAPCWKSVHLPQPAFPPVLEEMTVSLAEDPLKLLVFV